MAHKTLEDLEDFAERLQGPLGTALRSTGVILERRMRERGLKWADLDDNQVADLFLAAFLEAAPDAYPQLDRTVVEEAVRTMAANVKMELTANVTGSATPN
ncbi:hypothetical protein [Brevundimonas sp.]|uniref:hypothetical protein n=1 Tax=Brevundimonas sp. TaxID=1871086 RepID=UPI0028AB95EE|nr:hypothetical protein [Brevundimonas sp.]